MWNHFVFSSIALACLLSPASAEPAYVATPWVDAQSSQARLIVPAASDHDAGWRHAAIELRLADDAKTYWRTAGETGVPPTFSFGNSSGIRDAQALFPAPVAFDDGIGGYAYGYPGRAVFPIKYQATQSQGRLTVTLNYGVCLKNMCVPAQVTLSSADAIQSSPELGPIVQNAVAAVPIAVEQGHKGPLAVTAVRAKQSQASIEIEVDIQAPDGTKPSLFIEGADVYSHPTQRGERTFVVSATRGPSDSAKPWGDASLTVTAADHAIQTSVKLDTILAK